MELWFPGAGSTNFVGLSCGFAFIDRMENSDIQFVTVLKTEADGTKRNLFLPVSISVQQIVQQAPNISSGHVRPARKHRVLVLQTSSVPPENCDFQSVHLFQADSGSTERCPFCFCVKKIAFRANSQADMDENSGFRGYCLQTSG